MFQKIVESIVKIIFFSPIRSLSCSLDTYSGSDSCSGDAVGAAQTLVFDIPTDIEESVSALVEVEHLSIIFLFFVVFS